MCRITVNDSKNSSKAFEHCKKASPITWKCPDFQFNCCLAGSITNSEFDFDCAYFVRIQIGIWYDASIIHNFPCKCLFECIKKKGWEKKKLNTTHVTPFSLTTTSQNIAYIRFACWMVFCGISPQDHNSIHTSMNDEQRYFHIVSSNTRWTLWSLCVCSTVHHLWILRHDFGCSLFVLFTGCKANRYFEYRILHSIL